MSWLLSLSLVGKEVKTGGADRLGNRMKSGEWRSHWSWKSSGTIEWWSPNRCLNFYEFQIVILVIASSRMGNGSGWQRWMQSHWRWVDQRAERPARWSMKMLRAPRLVASLGRGGTMTQMFRLLISDREVYDESRRWFSWITWASTCWRRKCLYVEAVMRFGKYILILRSMGNGRQISLYFRRWYRNSSLGRSQL